MSAQTWNVGIIGYGLSAKVFHIPFITCTPGLKFHAIVQRNPKTGDDAEEDHRGIKSYRSSQELFADKSVDVVIVTTTPTTHFELAKDALESGKHVVVEKPFTPSSKEATELDAIAKKVNRLLAVYQNRRWDSDFLTLSSLLKAGTLGRVAEFETHFDRHRPDADTSGSWKGTNAPGHGVVYDLGTHLMDQVVALYGMPKKITGFVGSQREGGPEGFEDSCTILLHYDGLLATVKAGVVSAEVKQLRYWVRGTKGTFQKFHLDPQEPQLKAGMRPGDEGFGHEPEDFRGVLTLAEGSSFVSKPYPSVEAATYGAYYAQLVKALKGEGEVPVTAESAANIIRLVELARKSSKEGRTLEV